VGSEEMCFLQCEVESERGGSGNVFFSLGGLAEWGQMKRVFRERVGSDSVFFSLGGLTEWGQMKRVFRREGRV